MNIIDRRNEDLCVLNRARVRRCVLVKGESDVLVEGDVAGISLYFDSDSCFVKQMLNASVKSCSQ